MAKKTSNIAIAAAIKNKIVKALRETMGKALNQSNLVTQLCESIALEYGKQPVPAPAIKEITEALAKEEGWKGRTCDSRKSEVRAVLRSHHVLAGLCTAVTRDKRCETFSWHNAIKVARIWVRQNKKGTPSQASVIREFFKKAATSASDPIDIVANKIANLSPRKGTKAAALVDDLVQVLSKHGYVFE